MEGRRVKYWHCRKAFPQRNRENASTVFQNKMDFQYIEMVQGRGERGSGL